MIIRLMLPILLTLPILISCGQTNKHRSQQAAGELPMTEPSEATIETSLEAAPAISDSIEVIAGQSRKTCPTKSVSIEELEPELQYLCDQAQRQLSEDIHAGEKLDSLMAKVLLLPESFDYSFPLLTKREEPEYAWITILTSSDKRLKLYNYDVGGGTMRFYKTRYQYKKDDGQIVAGAFNKWELVETEVPEWYSAAYSNIKKYSKGYKMDGRLIFSSRDYADVTDSLSIEKILSEGQPVKPIQKHI